MRLASLKISGFKSFSDRTEVAFPAGITAIVGPNGCGKSNIGDALNWVLGEQSPTMLRGKHMADVIFNGSERRKPLGLAEVTLVLEGAEGLAAADEGRLSISRRLFRSGESDYLINGKRARLKDIQQILEHGRVGARSYATIEQGRIDQILNAKPKDRRILIEDAAGISGYKHKRRLTELKLEATHANLLRVNDIIVEVERQIRSLKRQAAKARRYRTLREELRVQQKLHFGLRAQEMGHRLTELRKAEQQAKDAESATAAGLGRRETALVDERAEVERAGQTYAGAAEQLHQLELAADRAENQIRTCADRVEEQRQAALRLDSEAQGLAEARAAKSAQGSELQTSLAGFVERVDKLEARSSVQSNALVLSEQALSAVREEIDGLRRRQFEAVNLAAERRNRRSTAEEALERNRAQARRLREERESAQHDLNQLHDRAATLTREHGELETRIDALRRAVAQGEQALTERGQSLERTTATLTAARERETTLAGQLHTLQDVATRFAGVSDGVRTLLAEGPAAGVRTHGVVADFVRAGREIESAAEGYLGTFLPTVILEDDSDVERATRLLRDAGAGRTSLISRSCPAGAPAVGIRTNGKGGSIPAALLADPRVRGRLRERLDLRTSLNGVLADRVGDAVVVDSLATALDLHRRYTDIDYLTADGDVVYASGVVATGGAQRGDQGLLAHSRRMEEVQDEARRETQAVGHAQSALDACRLELASAEAEIRGRRDELAACERRLVELDMKKGHAVAEQERTGKRDSVLADEMSGLAEEYERLTQELETLRGGVEEVEKDHAAIEERLAARVNALGSSETETRRLANVVATLNAERAGFAERRGAMEQEAARNAEALLELEGRVEALTSEATASRQRGDQAAELKTQTERELVDHLEQREVLSRQTRQMESAIRERREKLAAEENALRDTRSDLEELRERTRQTEIERTRSEADRANLDEVCRNELGVSAGEAAEQAGEEALTAAEPAQLAESIEHIKNKIDRLGPVNMTAIEEFSELEERHGFLSTQKLDLEQAMAKLRDTIRKINRTSRDRFTEAFEAVRTSYREVFQILFNGGKADLILEDPEDVLDSGIEIMVQPPGKRLGAINLMSGGEKALSAIALLFAIFRFQPSPFCLLDEVDAPLDDANVGRFARLLREYAEQTQFILVTHNKLSMDAADRLYGVTMQEPGVSRVISLQMQ